MVSAINFNERFKLIDLHLTSENSVDITTQGAIFRGISIYNIATVSDFRCPSNCTWKGSYISLGFASTCQDVTESTIATVAFSNATFGSWLNMTTPGNVTLEAKLSSAWRTQIQVVANATNIFPLDQFAPMTRQIVSPEIIRVGILRRSSEYDQGGFYDVWDKPEDYAEELEVFDCAIRFTAHNYTAMSASGNDITIAKEELELQPGIFEGLTSNSITFSQDGLPTGTRCSISEDVLRRFALLYLQMGDDAR